jgi:hypothetical protein
MNRSRFLILATAPAKAQSAYDSGVKSKMLTSENVLHCVHGDHTPKKTELHVKEKRSTHIVFEGISRETIISIVKHIMAKFPGKGLLFYVVGIDNIPGVECIASFEELKFGKKPEPVKVQGSELQVA